MYENHAITHKLDAEQFWNSYWRHFIVVRFNQKLQQQLNQVFAAKCDIDDRIYWWVSEWVNE